MTSTWLNVRAGALIWAAREERIEGPSFVYTSPGCVRYIRADVLEAGGNGTMASLLDLFAAVENRV